MSHSRFSLRLLLVAILVPAIGYAGQDLYELDFDPIIELGNMGLDTSFQGLESTLLNEQIDPMARYYSAVAIGQAAKKQSFEILISVLDDGSPQVVVGAITGLSELGDARAIDAYERKLNGQGPLAVQHASLMALARLNTDQARNAMAGAARNPNQIRDVRISAILLFERKPRKDSDQLFVELLKSNDSEIRARAAIGLSRRFAYEYDRTLAEMLVDETIPSYVLTDIVRQFERKSGKVFGNSRNPRMEGYSIEQKREVRNSIIDWINESENTQNNSSN
jgi:hypothetical protein